MHNSCSRWMCGPERDVGVGFTRQGGLGALKLLEGSELFIRSNAAVEGLSWHAATWSVLLGRGGGDGEGQQAG
jgi:hypothetical protein